MKARVYKDGSPQAVRAAVECLAAGGIAIIPTDTVYGMAVNPADEGAVSRLYGIKKRDRGKPLARFLPDAERFSDLPPFHLRRQVMKCASRFMPGPITIVVEHDTGTKTGIRIPDHPTAREVAARLDTLSAVTSVNVSGTPPLTRIGEITEAFGDAVDVIIDAGEVAGKPSTVVGFFKEGITVLREGGIPPERIREAAAFTLLFVCSGNICRSAAAEYYCRKALRETGKASDPEAAGFRVISAGTYMLEGNVPPPEVVSILASDGIDASGHRSRALTAALVEKADEIYVMERAHREIINRLAPSHAGKVKLLDPAGGDIPDPYNRSYEVYREVLTRVRNHVLEVVKTL